MPKDKECSNYSAMTEIERVNQGTAGGQPIYMEREIIISEFCSFQNKRDDFDCDKCPIKKEFRKIEN